MAESIFDFELVVNDGTPIIPACLVDLPNKVSFSESGCSSDRFQLFHIVDPSSGANPLKDAGYTGQVFDELVAWVDSGIEPTYVLLLLSQQPGSGAVIGAIAGGITDDRRFVEQYSNFDSDDVAEAFRIIRTGMEAQGLVAAPAPPCIPSIPDIPAHMDFRA